MFKAATQKSRYPTITLNEESASIASGKAKFIGPRIVGILMSREEVTTDNGTAPVYEIALYANPMDDSKFGMKPDGETVALWGGDVVLRDRMEEGNEGEQIPVGAVIQIECLGRKFGKTGFAKSKGYIDYEVGFFMPKATFSAAGTPTGQVSTPVAPPAQPTQQVPTAPAAPKFEGNKSLEDLGY